MIDYSQPDFYRFNSDSLDLVKWVSSKHLDAQRLLDLGSGCGVIGLEYHHLRPVKDLVLLEVQDEFQAHLKKNVEGTVAQIYQGSFSQFYPDKAFDLILCNPPYYLPGAGEVSQNPNRHMARTFIRDDWGALLSCVERSLSPEGFCFIVIKDNKLLCELASQNPSLKLRVHSVQKGILFLELTRLYVERA